ncbi:MAG TPA: FMN-binding protein [Treponemataceae bacterium]|nr:FMN-binding protein [Treponemataceae bacterium]
MKTAQLLPTGVLVALLVFTLTAQKCSIEVDLAGRGPEGTRDGVWEGSFDTDLVKATVLVTTENEKIADIEIVRHDNGMGKKAEAVIDQVIASQSTSVDVVSGATLSSKVILRAVEEALNKASSGN